MTELVDHEAAHAERSAAAADLGDALRGLVEAAVVSDVDVDAIASVAEQVRGLAGRLAERRRDPRVLSVLDDLGSYPRFYGPASGVGNPVAPPLVFDPSQGPTARGRVTLGERHAGHLGIAHGGVVGTLLDDVLGKVSVREAWPSVTLDLAITYRRPVPIGTELVVAARMTERDGRRLRIVADCRRADDPDEVLAEAVATYLQIADHRFGV